MKCPDCLGLGLIETCPNRNCPTCKGSGQVPDVPSPPEGIDQQLLDMVNERRGIKRCKCGREMEKQWVCESCGHREGM